MSNSRCGWVIFCALAATLGCRSDATDWNGNWKLNPTQSSFQGPIITISISADGEYRYDDGYTNLTFYCDGKDRSTGNSRTRVCERSSATELELTQKENGVKISTSRWDLSVDRNVFTATATTFRPNRPVSKGLIVLSRMSGSNDFAGTWQDRGYLKRHAAMTVTIDTHALHIGYPEAGQYIDAPFDGTDVAVHGPGAPQGLTYTARLVGRNELVLLGKRNGKVLQDSLKLTNNGKVITYAWWDPDRPTDKGTLVYERQ